MEAHYLLGCVYRDLGEAPRAIEAYQDAVARADTTAQDCDYRTLGCVYSQMADVFHRQLLLSYEIEARRKSRYYAILSNNLLWAISSLNLSAGAYILLNKKDSAEYVVKEAIRLYNESGNTQDAVRSSMMLMYLYENLPDRISDFKLLIDRFEAETALFNEHHELSASLRKFYYYKGRYYEETNQLDSAEHYYRIVYRPNMSFTSLNPMYKGLLSIFQKRHQADSIAKYAQLYCTVNDSSIAVKDRDLTAQMAANYNYTRYQQEAYKNEVKAYSANIRFIFTALVLTAIVVVMICLAYQYRKNRKKQKAAYDAALAGRAKLQEELDRLIAKDYETVIAQKESEIRELGNVIAKHEAAYQRVLAKDRMTEFEESEIVRFFDRKREFRKGEPALTSADWDELVREFSKDMPSAYATIRCLSDLQLHVCILLLLDYEEGVIAALKDTKPQTVNSAKVRANKKLFQSGDATSLKTNLKGLIAF